MRISEKFKFLLNSITLVNFAFMVISAFCHYKSKTELCNLLFYYFGVIVVSFIFFITLLVFKYTGKLNIDINKIVLINFFCIVISVVLMQI